MEAATSTSTIEVEGTVNNAQENGEARKSTCQYDGDNCDHDTIDEAAEAEAEAVEAEAENGSLSVGASNNQHHNSSRHVIFCNNNETSIDTATTNDEVATTFEDQCNSNSTTTMNNINGQQQQQQEQPQQQEQEQKQSEYELKRSHNIERNNRRLVQLGLRRNDPACTLLESPERKKKRPPSEHNTVTPPKDTKQLRRTSSRIQKLKEQQQCEASNHDHNDDDGVVPDYDDDRDNHDHDLESTPTHVNGYYEVDKILDRRVRNIRNDPGRKVVEYLVQWKNNIHLDENEEPTPWLIAENLDQNSLAEAFRKFPVDLDPDDRRQPPPPHKKRDQHESPKDLFARMTVEEEADIDSGFNNSDTDEDELYEEDEDHDDGDNDDDADLLQLGDSGEGNNNNQGEDDDVLKDPSMMNEISSLRESDYDQPGTVELIINRRVYRVGQSFISENNKKIIHTITTIIPRSRKAICQQFILFDHTFVCPKGCEGTYVQLTEDATIDLSSLKVPYKHTIRKLPLMYEQDNEQQRSFCYYNEEGKIHNRFPQCKPIALDLFAGVGGMSIGLKNAGFDVKFSVENNHITAATLQANLLSNTTSNSHVFVEDVHVFLKRCGKGHPSYPSGVGDVDHIHASTPCKGFSRANRNGGSNDLRNNQQTLLFIQAIKHFKPMTAVFENVPGLVLKDYRRYLQSMVTSLLRMSYQVRVSVLNASSYGDPQNRRRLFLWAARKDCVLPSIPIETHGPHGRHPLNTCKDVLQALEGHIPMPSRSSGVVSIKSNNSACGAASSTTTVYNHICPKFKKDNNDTNDNSTFTNHHHDDNFVLKENLPSRTILARARPYIHYKFNRYITVREAACLQSFPSTFQFFGSLSNQYSQVGNAVPIKLSTAVARSVAEVHDLP